MDSKNLFDDLNNNIYSWEPFGSNNRSILDEYIPGDFINKGGFGNVFEARKKRINTKEADNKIYAIKQIPRPSSSSIHWIYEEELIKNEIRILRKMRHPHIVTFYDDFVDDDNYYIVTEYLEGGDLYDKIYRKWSKDASPYNEKYVRDVCRVLFETVSFLHDNNIAHLDLKPENLLLESTDENTMVKIADFGLAQEVASDYSLSQVVGTKGYQAPEVLKKNCKYGTKADMFSLGVIAYTLIRGSTPFCSRKHPECQKYGAFCVEDRVVCEHRILKQKYRMEEEPYWRHVSSEAKSMIRSLLTIDPEKRLSAKEALEHDWMRANDEDLEAVNLSFNFMAFEKFNQSRRKFRKAANTVRAMIKMRKSISNATTQTASTDMESNGSNTTMTGCERHDNDIVCFGREECRSFGYSLHRSQICNNTEREDCDPLLCYRVDGNDSYDYIFPFDP